MSHRVHRLLTTLFSAPIKGWNGQKWPVCLSLFICLCWFISLCGAALFASSLLDSLPPLGIEWPRRPSSKYTPIFTWRSVCLKSLLFEGKPLRLLGNSGILCGNCWWDKLYLTLHRILSCSHKTNGLLCIYKWVSGLVDCLVLYCYRWIFTFFFTRWWKNNIE